MTAGVDFRVLRAAVFTAVCVTLSAAGHHLASGGSPLSPAVLALASAAVLAVALPLAGRERNLPQIAALLAASQLALHTLFTCGQRPAAPSAPGATDVRDLAARLVCGGGSGMTGSEARRIVADSGLSPAELRQMSGAPAAHAGHTGGGIAPDGLFDSPLGCLRGVAHAVVSMLDLPMLLGHLLVALVLGWVLRRGEAALWRLVRLSARSTAAAVGRAADGLRCLRRAVAYLRALCAGLLPPSPARGFTVRRHEECTPSVVLLQHSADRRGPPARTLALAA